MMYVFYIIALLSFSVSNVVGFIILNYNFDMDIYLTVFISAIVNGFCYGYLLKYVVTVPLIAVIDDCIGQMFPIVIETNQPKKQKKEKSEFSESHREKLRLSSMKRTRDANGRFK